MARSSRAPRATLRAALIFVLVGLAGLGVAGGFDWSGCGERALPKTTPLGNCTANATATCAAALDGNSTTFYNVGVLQVEQRLFGALQSIDAGPGFPGSMTIGISLGGARAVLTRAVLIPHPNISEWDPPPHVYNPPKQFINWSTAVVGGMLQGSQDGVAWETLYTVAVPLAMHPANSTFVLANMTVKSCTAYAYFRYYNTKNATRSYFVNTALGPVEKIETISLASLADVNFYGVPAASSTDLSCLASHPGMAIVAAPNPGVFQSSASVVLWTPLFKCGASLYFTVDGTIPSTGSILYVEGNAITFFGGVTDGV